MEKAQIRFGTSGWRAILAEDFTVANVRRAIKGIARFVAKHPAANGLERRIIVGRDPRFMGETFVQIAAEVLAAHGIVPLVIGSPAPTPAISYEVLRRGADGAINFTASHNPPEYNGVKFNSSDGAPALPEITKAIEAEVIAADAEAEKRAGSQSDSISVTKHPSTPSLESIDIKAAYLARLTELVDLHPIRKSGIKVAYDAFWGAGAGYSSALLREAGVPVTPLHEERDVTFGGHAPEPEGELLDGLRQSMRDSGARIGIATDGDADRFGIVDLDGTFIQPNYIIALLFDYLVETRGWKNGVAKSVATTNMINALAEHHQVELHETPVGFKYIGELIKADRIAIGGEESAGLSIRGHVPEKDGIIAGLLCCEAVATRGTSIREQIEVLFGKVGSFYPVRENFHLTEEAKAKFTSKLGSDPREFAGRKVVRAVRTDGLKLVLDDGSWVLYRLSGTEPVVRAYSEARSEGDAQKLKRAAEEWIFS